MQDLFGRWEDPARKRIAELRNGLASELETLGASDRVSSGTLSRLAIYATGSLARLEASEYSDLDGPFSKKINFPRDLDYRRHIYIVGCGRFKNEGRHAVYLNVGTFDLAARMNKPDFPNAIPHLTVYEGTDAVLADHLFDRLRETRLFGSFIARRLEVVESRSQYSADFALGINLALDQRTANLTYNQLVDLETEVRVDIAISSLMTGLTREISSVEFNNRRVILKDIERRGRK